jgi:hypothetical protein
MQNIIYTCIDTNFCRRVSLAVNLFSVERVFTGICTYIPPFLFQNQIGELKTLPHEVYLFIFGLENLENQISKFYMALIIIG